VDEVQTIRRGRRFIGENHRYMNIYNPDGNKVITFEYPDYVKFDMKVIENHINDYIIKVRKKKLKNLNKK